MGTPRTASRGRNLPEPRSGAGAAHSSAPPGAPNRRTVLRGAAVAGLGVPFLAACGSDASTAGDSSSSSTPGTKKSSASAGSGDASSALASTSEVPEGGGLILAGEGVVITQPSSGTFEGFSSTCTHAGCPLDNVSDGTINCICHGSRFSIEDGSVVNGPASTPLPKKPLVVKGSEISLR